MSQIEHFGVIAIPLNRPEIIDFLLPPRPKPRGAALHVVGTRPADRAETEWVARLRTSTAPTAADLLAIDDPHGYLVKTHTDRLVPVEFLAEPDFLTRNLGGWTPIYFNVAALPPQWPDDPLLKQAELLTEYGPKIRYFGADPGQVAARLEEETGGDSQKVAAAFDRLHTLRQQMGGDRTTYVERLYGQIAAGRYFATDNQPPLSDLLLLDELLGQLVRLELSRRAALARDDKQEATAIRAWQAAQEQQSGLKLILKGEYLAGRHRSSLVLLAPELGLVIKQPAPEPYHEIKLKARVVNGQEENWPYPTGDGSLVTPRGRIRLVIEEDLVPRLNRVFGHGVRFSSLLGLIIEPFVEGQTVQEFVLEDPGRMTSELYDLFVLHQQVCEVMGIENGDWHAANFVRRNQDGRIVHIDWGAARPLNPAERTPEGRLARLNQVRNIGYSFHRPALAERVLRLHAELVADEERLDGIRERARALAEADT